MKKYKIKKKINKMNLKKNDYFRNLESPADIWYELGLATQLNILKKKIWKKNKIKKKNFENLSLQPIFGTNWASLLN